MENNEQKIVKQDKESEKMYSNGKVYSPCPICKVWIEEIQGKQIKHNCDPKTARKNLADMRDVLASITRR